MRCQAASFNFFGRFFRPDIAKDLRKSRFLFMGLASLVVFIRLLIHQTCKPRRQSNKGPTGHIPSFRLLHHDTLPVASQRRFRECLNCPRPIAGCECALKTKKAADLQDPPQQQKTIQALGAWRGLTIANIPRLPSAQCSVPFLGRMASAQASFAPKKLLDPGKGPSSTIR